MKDEHKTRQVLIAENDDLRQRIQELEQISAGHENRGYERPQSEASGSEVSYRALFNYSNEAILSTSPDGTILDANPAASEMFGRPREEIRRIGRNGLVDLTGPRLHEVLGLVQARSGVVAVDSSPGHGSRYRVFLPVAAEGDADRSTNGTCTTEDRPAGKILLVDDDDIIVDITTMMLVRLGFTVLSAGDGIQAMDIFRQHQNEICLVLSDVYMPGMNGWETLSALRRIDPGIAVILISGYGEEQVMEGGHPDLPQAFLRKPYSFEVLKDAIHRALQEIAG
ncbi:response regulator [Desulfoprunum benzoelyticum]|uniref:histidine kinase n=1 Tax=Desulfoprunum benzoelyticum TaxID=1506996 RepID=A0A840UUK6_9BACT|nr:response regulator [Desulfoprunum benzoelyticum]MBB5349462.1 CheY-like chemotaxis protein [Desulfoprunum benzoelyticum]MBM9531475.1 response regulator [Desulfoprunum benzoelyticum]